MIPELGLLSLLFAMALSAVQTTMPFAGVAFKRVDWIALARPAAVGQFLFLALAFGLLVHAFLTNDFAVANVALNSNSLLPTFYKVAAAWGSHEGSMLFWCLILSLWTVGVSIGGRYLEREFVTLMIAVLGLLSFGVLAFTVFTSSPFLRLDPVPLEGRDLNPLLQDPAMVLHPPALYLGYVGFSVPFAFALAALLRGRLEPTWIRWVRPWTLWPWVCLTIGITVGSWWAYYELGWGGWWFWDAVENASFMPWLLGTALLHSLAVAEKRGLFLGWTLLLCIGTCSLSLLGTFLTRSGVLISVHAFASDPTRGMFILVLLGLISGGALTVYAIRAARFVKSGGVSVLSRESFLLLNNILLTVAAFIILWGTLYPLFLDALGLGKITVGPPWFEFSFLIPVLPLVVLLGLGIHASWRQTRGAVLMQRVRTATVVAIVVCLPLAASFLSRDDALGVVGLALGVWIIASSFAMLLFAGVRERGRRLPASIWGMSVAHVGLGLFVVGVSIANNGGVEMDRAIGIGERTEIADYELEFTELRTGISGVNYEAIEGVFAIYRSGERIATLRPQKRVYRGQESAMTEAGIDARWSRDLFVALGDDLGAGRWSVRILYQPMIRFIWVGALVIAFGGILASRDRRYRIAAAQERQEEGTHLAALRSP